MIRASPGVRAVRDQVVFRVVDSFLYEVRVDTGRQRVCSRKTGPRKKMVRPAGFEPTTPGSGGRCSIHLSYGRT